MVGVRHLRYRWMVLGLVVGLALIAVPPAHAVNIVTNPGFESGDAGWTIASFLGSNLWETTASNPLVHSGTKSAFTGCVGASCVTLGDPHEAFLFQDLATSATDYTISFWLANTTKPQAPLANDLVVRFGGNVIFDLSDQPTDGVFRQFTGTLAASAGTTRLQFDGRNDPDFLWLDDVCVATTESGTCGGGARVVTPQPASLILVGVSLLGLVMLSRRFSRPLPRSR